MTLENAARSRVLVLLPTAKDSERTVTLLGESNVHSVACTDLAELCREIRTGADAILMADEVIFSDITGILAEVMREQPPWSAVPVIILAREGSTPHVQKAASGELTSLTIVERPVRMHTLVSMVLSALRTRHHQYQIRDAMLVREQQAAELRDQEERLRFALSAGGLGSWDLDLETNVLECSSICKANFGRGPKDPFSYQDLHASVIAEDKARVLEAIARSIRDAVDYDIEYRVLWPNAEVHWVMVRGRATYDENGKARRMVGVSLDITESKRLQEALETSRVELARQAAQLLNADRRKDEFLATLAHELRNPLAPIRTGLQLLSAAPPPETTRRTLGVMQRQIAHMVRLIDDLLDVSRITRGKLELRREQVPLGAVVDAAVEASRPYVDRSGHELRVTVPEPALMLDADLTRLAQVVSNLLNNSSKYTTPGGVIELSTQRHGDEVTIEVRDNGVGIPQDRISDVFEMFSQVDRTFERTHGGLGIGLALVRSLVEMHGGAVSAVSDGVGTGSTFTVRLPLVPAVADERAPEPSPLPPVLHDRRRILVVDDNDDAAELLALMLGQAGYATEVAHDGPEALARLANWTPDIAILDIGLPGMSGYDIARELRRDRRFADITLIALTGWGTEGDKQKATDAGFDTHLTKPVDARELHGTIARLRGKLRGPTAVFSRPPALR
ncbi:MAG TPA: ATP-binding protein [Polyangiaceae bacterium]|jgi:signal transduction histidine kinase/ActR/RegA family two-component response regulator|nr:ATP-binding protein [Polyangiaceae bacterium]